MASLSFDGATRLHPYNDTETPMTFPDTRVRAVRCIASQPRRTLIAIAAGTLMLAGCGSSDNDNGNNGNNGSQPPQVNQINTLKGATKDVTVEMHEGTNMAAAPSPDGTRI